MAFFKTIKHRVFNYQPLFYDERKEAMQDRYDRLDDERKTKEGESTYKPGKLIRTNLRKNIYGNKATVGENSISRIITIIGIILVLTIFFYFADLFTLLFPEI